MWIHFLGLNIVYYDESVLRVLVKEVGRPVKVDVNTANYAWGKFANAYMEVDFTKPVLGRVGCEGE